MNIKSCINFCKAKAAYAEWINLQVNQFTENKICDGCDGKGYYHLILTSGICEKCNGRKTCPKYPFFDNKQSKIYPEYLMINSTHKDGKHSHFINTSRGKFLEQLGHKYEQKVNGFIANTLHLTRDGDTLLSEMYICVAKDNIDTIRYEIFLYIDPDQCLEKQKTYIKDLFLRMPILNN